ncbi:MAG: hypothetical protein BGO70_02445 [Bacteroidetes bacterium 43-93]|nr:hypothetical protein [Bacteroidota bacterium]OJW99156.1 MAG: hypothetical protein BGO70_02445 [Bacteroidetes bacterium 43-93]
MKKVILFILIALPSIALAQSITLVSVDYGQPVKTNPTPVCYTHEVLEKISDQMYQQGNPKYIWVDLLKDRYITNDEGHTLNLYISAKNASGNGNVPIPAEASKKYAEKWVSFVKSLHLKVDTSTSYHLYASNGIQGADVVNEKSEFRSIIKGELYYLNLNPQGELRFYKELIKEGLASENDSLSWNFTINGYFVNGKRLNAEQREKFRNIGIEEFGTDYNKIWQTTNSSMGYPLQHRMQKLTSRLDD